MKLLENYRADGEFVLSNARMIIDGQMTRGWVRVADGMIEEVGTDEIPMAQMAHFSYNQIEVIDCFGRLLMPGVIDEHVHFRDPGLTHKADMATESRAAVAGGVTSFIDMPNTNPAAVTIADVEAKRRRASEVSLANYGFFIGATNDNLSELMMADFTRIAGVKLFLGSSTGNMLVDSDSTISRIFRDVKALIAVHAEDESEIAAGRAKAREEYGDNPPVKAHPQIRSAEACYKATKRAVEMARATKARLHVMHVSTERELEFFAPGPIEKKNITCETCPQYLLFSDEDYDRLGARIKCNPAIKSPSDRSALRRAVASGVIDVIATDHAPHLLREKQGSAFTAVSGMPMIQFSLPVMLTLAGEGVVDYAKVEELMCNNPARLFNIDRRGFIRKGYYADFVLVDTDCEPYTVWPDMIESRCRWSPLEGEKLTAKVVATWVNGRIVYADGEVISGAPCGKALRFAPRSKKD